jgi:hypothetical protein
MFLFSSAMLWLDVERGFRERTWCSYNVPLSCQDSSWNSSTAESSPVILSAFSSRMLRCSKVVCSASSSQFRQCSTNK